MRRTLGEIYHTCQKAAEGAGAPPGVDLDAAAAAVWLSARGLEPFAALADDLERLAAQPTALVPDDVGGPDHDPAFDATGKAGALIAPALIDLLVASAMDDGGRLTVRHLSAPWFLLPFAARYAEDGWCFRLALESAAERFEVTMAANAALIRGSADRLPNRTTAHCGLHCARRTDGLPKRAADDLTILGDQKTLATAAKRGVANGVMVAPALWDRLQTFAYKVLVPATEESRRRGAG